MAHKLSFNGKPIPSDSPTTVSNTGLETYLTGNLTSLVNSSCYLSICRHIDKPPLSLRGRHSKIRGKGLLGMGEMLGVREGAGTSLCSPRVSLVPTPAMQATRHL